MALPMRNEKVTPSLACPTPIALRPVSTITLASYALTTLPRLYSEFMNEDEATELFVALVDIEKLKKISHRATIAPAGSNRSARSGRLLRARPSVQKFAGKAISERAGHETSERRASLEKG
jgi:hypothetical protein